MLGILIPCKLEESYMVTEISEGIISLGIMEVELKLWKAWKAPEGLTFSRKLGWGPKFEDFRLALELSLSLLFLTSMRPGI